MPCSHAGTGTLLLAAGKIPELSARIRPRIGIGFSSEDSGSFSVVDVHIHMHIYILDSCVFCKGYIFIRSIFRVGKKSTRMPKTPQTNLIPVDETERLIRAY